MTGSGRLIEQTDDGPAHPAREHRLIDVRVADGADQHAFEQADHDFGNRFRVGRIVGMAIAATNILDGAHQFAATGFLGRAHDRRNVRVARGFSDDFDLESGKSRVEMIGHAGAGAFDEAAAQVAGCAQFSAQSLQDFEIPGDDGRNDRFLVGEVVVDVAGAHAGQCGNLVDAGGMKAMLAKALRCRAQDLFAAGVGAVGFNWRLLGRFLHALSDVIGGKKRSDDHFLRCNTG